MSAEGTAHPSGICALAWSSDGSRLASGDNDGSIRIWTHAQGRLHPLATLTRHRGSVRALAWSPDDRWLASGAEDGTVAVWDADYHLTAVPQTGRRWVNALAWSPDGARLSAAGGDRAVVVTDPEGRRTVVVLDSPYGVFLSLAWSPDGGQLAATRRASTLDLWETEHWSPARQLDGGPGAVWTSAWLPSGRTLATGNALGTIKIWDTESGDLVTTIDGHGGAVARVTANGDGRVLASLSHDETIGVWGPGGQPLRRIAPVYPGWSGCLVFHPTENLLAGTDVSGRSVVIREVTASPTLPSGWSGSHRHPILAEIRDRIGTMRLAGERTLTPDTLAGRLSTDHPDLTRPGGWVDVAVAQLTTEGEVARRHRLVDLDPKATAWAADAVTREGHPDGLVDVRAAVGEQSWRLVAHALISDGRAWPAEPTRAPVLYLPEVARAGPPEVPHVATEAVERRWTDPELPSVETSNLLADLVSTTLLPHWIGVDGALMLGDRERRRWLWALVEHRHGELVLTLATPDGPDGLRDLLAELLARRLQRRRPEARGRPARQLSLRLPDLRLLPGWRSWREPSIDRWALTPEDLGTDLRHTLAILDEHVDDERSRQQRLPFLPQPGDRDPSYFDDVLIWHRPDDLPVARELRRQLAAMGVAAWCDEGGALTAPTRHPEILARVDRAGVVLLLATAGLCGDWESQPFTHAYQAVREHSSATRRRVRWLPVVSGVAAGAVDVPPFLHSFDWFTWEPNPTERQRDNLTALLGGIMIDRARS